jgi:hypothetical protein
LREPLVLYAQGGLSYEEIAAQLNITLASVKIRIFRARQELEYHAGEASQASRALLAEAAPRNPVVAAAMSAPPPAMAPLPADPARAERRMFRKLRLRYQALSFAFVWTVTFVLAMLAPHWFSPSEAAVALWANPVPLVVPGLVAVGVVVERFTWGCERCFARPSFHRVAWSRSRRDDQSECRRMQAA